MSDTRTLDQNARLHAIDPERGLEMKRTEPLFPRHDGQKEISKPRNMTEIKMKQDERKLLEREALSIFTDCCNSGLPLRSTLLAIFVTGMDWGINCTKGEI